MKRSVACKSRNVYAAVTLQEVVDENEVFLLNCIVEWSATATGILYTQTGKGSSVKFGAILLLKFNIAATYMQVAYYRYLEKG